MKRIQRLKQTQLLRDLTADTFLRRAQLIQPLFAVDGIKSDEAVPGLVGVSRQSIDSMVKQVADDVEKGVTQFLLFSIPGQKSEKDFDRSYLAKSVEALKSRFKNDISLWVDICLCSSTTHGHCCVFDKEGKVETGSTLDELAEMAFCAAQAGADGVSPSDMQDGRVAAIRSRLDSAGYEMTPIMSYSTKFASTFYGPFRVAADSAPKFGDRKAYQLDVRNRTEALAASQRCAEEGADLLMVKPGITSLDLIAPIQELTGRPCGAYQVSGEFASLYFLAENKLANFEAALLETWYALRRGGAQYIITYGARMAKAMGI